ncbi:MAG: hypothetical protein QW735_04250 [archaeon]
MENFIKIAEALLARSIIAAEKGNYSLAAELCHRAALFYRKGGDETKAIQCEDSARDFDHLSVDKEAVQARKLIAEGTIRAAEINADALNSSVRKLGSDVSAGFNKLGANLGQSMRYASENLSSNLLRGAKIQADSIRLSGEAQAKATLESGKQQASAIEKGLKDIKDGIIVGSETQAEAFLSGTKYLGDKVSEGFEKQARATRDVADATRDVADATRDVAHATNRVADATQDVANATRDVADATRDVADATRDVAHATNRVADATQDVANATYDNSQSIRYLGDKTYEGLNNQSDAIREVSRATEKAGKEISDGFKKGSIKAAQINAKAQFNTGRRIERAVVGGPLSDGILNGIFNQLTGNWFKPGVAQELRKNKKE